MQGDIYSVKISQVYGHYEVYVNDEFYCSADSLMEAMQEVEAIV